MIKDIDTKLKSLHESLPHLPVDARKWLARNAWWIVAAIVILGAVGLLQQARFMFGYGNIISPYTFYFTPAFAYTAFWISTITHLVVLIISAAAISPLKQNRFGGWQALLVAGIVGLAGGLLAGILSPSTGSLVGLVIGTIVYLYFLYEVRDEFSGDKKRNEKSDISLKDKESKNTRYK